MSITETPLYQLIKKHQTIAIGNLFFFKNFVVAEFNHGVNVSFDSLYEYDVLVGQHFGDKDYGLISNRINSYSIDLNDASKFNAQCKNLKAYATVTYNSISEKVFNVESHFLKFNKQNF